MNSETNTSSNRSFGIVFSIVFLIIAIYPLINNEDIRNWSLIVSLIFLILGYLKSRILTPLNSLWFKFGIFLGRIVSPIILGVIYYFIVTPTSILMRLFKKDLLNLKFSNNNSYWINKHGPKSKMKNQY
tara:strand:+ start:191 stop:577 length:387 start_codon:yes stop_codon:yes gene_type:complete